MLLLFALALIAQAVDIPQHVDRPTRDVIASAVSTNVLTPIIVGVVSNSSLIYAPGTTNRFDYLYANVFGITQTNTGSVLLTGLTPALMSWDVSRRDFFFGGAGNTTMTGTDNFACGALAMGANTSGNNNYALGSTALQFNTTGTDNLAAGIAALRSNVVGNRNVAAGTQALDSSLASDNTCLGFRAFFTASAGHDNTAVGAGAGLLTTGSYNTFMGVAVGEAITGGENSAFGWQALHGTGAASQNCAFGLYSLRDITSGTYNVAAGHSSLRGITSGGFNVAVGSEAGIGASAPNEDSLVDTHCIFIGHQASRDGSILNSTPLVNAVAIGRSARVGANNTTQFGSAAVPMILNVTSNLNVTAAFNQVPLTFNLSMNTVASSNQITFAHATVPSGKTVTINYVQSLNQNGTAPGTNQVVRIYDATAASTVLATNGNWVGSVTIPAGNRWYATFENNSSTNIVISSSIHGNIK